MKVKIFKGEYKNGKRVWIRYRKMEEGLKKDFKITIPDPQKQDKK